MPIYEFVCKSCNEKYEELTKMDETEIFADVVCPHCGGKTKDRLMSVCSWQFSNPLDTDRWNNDSTGHDYRFKTNLPKVIEQRKQAELNSHMGAKPYTDTSEKDFKLDTGIHDAGSRGGLS